MNMRRTKERQRRVPFKRWFHIHIWSAFLSVVLLLMLVVTGMLIYPLDQLGLRDIPLRSLWLPSLYEVNTWESLLRSLAVSPEGWLYATHKYGVFFSQDGGQRWHDLTERIPGSVEPPPGLFPPVLALYPFDPRIIVASKGRGLARSDDGGTGWEPFGDSDDADLSNSRIQNILYGPPVVVLAIDEQGLRTLHHVGGLVSWPLFVLFPLTGVVLLHGEDVPALVRHGLPTRWLPPQFDHNRWQGPVRLYLRTLAISPTHADRLWIGHTYGLVASEDRGQHWTN